MTSDRISQGLAHWPELASAAGLPVDGWVPQLISSRRDAKGDRVILRLERQGFEPVICKQGLAPADIAGTAAAVMAQERAAAGMTGPRDVGVPQILGCLPERGAVVMQAVTGRNLTDLVEDGASPAALRRAGEWVDAFHRIGPLETRAFQPRFIVNHLRDLVDQERKGTRQIARARQFRLHVAELARRAPGAKGAPTISSLRHGDLNGRNLILSDDAVWGIDFAEAGTGPVGFDIARLLIHLAERAPTRAVNAAVPAEMISAFFDGYRLTGADDASVRFLCLARILTNWASMPPDEEDMTILQTIRFQRMAALAAAGLG